MSHQDPGTGSDLDQDIAVPAERKPGGLRRYLVAFLVAALGAAGVGAAVWAWQSFMDQGAQPAEALPANTLAYAAIDLDPPGGQKVEAFKTLQRFPAIKQELGLGSVDDVQKSVVKQLTADTGCKLGYSSVKDWLGDRAAAAVVAQDKPEAVLVLQVADQAKARASLGSSSADCGFGFALHGDWAVLARTRAVATRASEDASRAALSDHRDFTRLTGAAGSAGLVTLYAAPAAGKALLDMIDKDPFTGTIALEMVNGALDPVSSFVTSFGLLAVAQPFGGSVEATSASTDEEPRLTAAQQKEQREINTEFEHFDQLSKAEQKALEVRQEKFFDEVYNFDSSSGSGTEVGSSSSDDELASEDVFPTPKLDPQLRASLQKFTGIGGVGRFADHGLEVEIVGDQLNGTSADMYAGSRGKSLAAELPQNTAVAFGAGLASGWVDVLFGQLSGGALSSTGQDKAQVIKSFEKSTGLDVPADLEALGGEGVSVVAGPGFDPSSVFGDGSSEDLAVRVTGDATKIETALAKLRAHASSGSKLLSRRVGDGVLVSANRTFLDELAKSGGLGGSDDFKAVVPDAEGAATVFYVNFDAGNWLTKSVSGSDRANAAPLHALGMSVTKGEGQQHILIRLSFD